jgi:hypothetical protein
MRRLDYLLIEQTLAQALNECRTEPISGVMLTIEQFMDNLSIDNKAFNKLMFLHNIRAYVVNERGVRALDKRIEQLELSLMEVVRVF